MTGWKPGQLRAVRRAAAAAVVATALLTPTHARAAEPGTASAPAFDARIYETLRSAPPATRSVTAPAPDDGMITYRVVGGHPALAGAWPSMAGILVRLPDGKVVFHCGGTVIDGQWLLTAAHCLRLKRADGAIVQLRRDVLIVRTGTHDLTRDGRDLAVTEMIVHPKFDRDEMSNDIALLKLASPADVARQYLAPRGMAADLIKPPRLATTMGFGLTTPLALGVTREEIAKGKRSDLLKQADVPIVDKAKCIAGYRKRRPIASLDSEGTFCAGHDEGGTDACKGDSGGPLLVRDALGQAVQVGIVSFGLGCAQPEAWGIYTSVAYYQDWIKSHVPGANFGDEKPPTARPPELAAADQAIQTLLGSQLAAAPSQSGQVAIDLLPGSRVAIGDRFRIRVTSSIAGTLILYSRDDNGGVVQLFPHDRSTGTRLGETPRSIAAGQTLRFPTQFDGFALDARGPAGRKEIIAIVLAPAVRTEDLTQPYEGFRTLADPAATLGALALRTRDLFIESRTDVVRAVGHHVYEIVEREVANQPEGRR